MKPTKFLLNKPCINKKYRLTNEYVSFTQHNLKTTRQYTIVYIIAVFQINITAVNKHKII